MAARLSVRTGVARLTKHSKKGPTSLMLQQTAKGAFRAKPRWSEAPALPQKSFCGSAAGCEARLCRAVDFAEEIGLGPWYGLWPINAGQARTRGRAQGEFRGKRRGRAAPHIPAAEPQQDFRGKAARTENSRLEIFTAQTAF